MKKLLITILLFAFFSNVNSQILQMRVLTVENKDIPEFESAVAKKTQMYNDFIKKFPDAYLNDVILDKKDKDK